MNRFFLYLKFYFSIKHKDLRDLALDSYREYAKAHPERQFDINFCQGYQRGFIDAYRRSYAKAMIGQ